MKFNLIAVFLVCGAALFSKNALAQNAERKPGFYLGPSIGMTQFLGSQYLTYYNRVAGLFGLKSTAQNATFCGGGMVGYHLPVTEKSFVDIDTYYVHQNNQATFSRDENGFMYVSVELRKKYSYGAAVSLGKIFYEGPGVMPLSGYIRLGIERGEIQNKRRYTGNEYRGLSFQGSDTFTSFAPGFGLKLNLKENAFLKVGYTYVFPHTYNIYLPYTENGGGYYNHKFRHHEQRVEFSLGYQF